MGAVSPMHLLIILVIALVVIGPRKLPDTGAALGKAIREFRDANREDAATATVMPPAEAAVPMAATAAIPAEAISATPAVFIENGSTPEG
jgi:sec-independent protein translocase protein TatA